MEQQAEQNPGRDEAAERIVQSVRLARQPIVDADLKTIGYELLYRAADSDQVARIGNSNQATASTVLNALSEIGLDHLVGGKLAFINVPGKLLFSDVLEGISAHSVVLEVLETVDCDERCADAIRRMKKAGYRIALDDFPPAWIDKPCVAESQYVKFDVFAVGVEATAAAVPAARRAGLKVIAEKVEDWDAYDRLRGAGVDYFQGHFVSRPEMVVRPTVRASKANLMGLIVLLQDEEASLAEIVERINTDLALSYRLLRLVNSSAIGLRRRVDSVEEAVRLLGLNAVRSLVYLSALTGVDGKPPALIHNTMVRARFAELLAAQSRMANPPTAFLVGLFSNLDAFYNQPLAQLVEELPLTEDVARALLEGEGSLGELLEYVRFYEKGQWLEGDIETAVTALNEVAPNCYLDALRWDEALRESLGGL
ncbi:HDOD domain-containing protein [Guyparkeria hydrothermalis]|uniref:EAL and HDOD domain-containing protein n=1 Tax=Guyparkeria hydrothermalis TaxID=923 RepID=UPI0020220692|nr:HDOD domain-containing protein [Guyparkeria hydrothermalis]MCL7743379.1 HDOD domain-containing protein [Guyparkeria hydrothermalis]